MNLGTSVEQAAMLYFSDAATILLFAAGFAWLIATIATHQLARLFVEITPKEATRFLYMLLAIVLLALVGFKFIVLSGGPHIAVHTILKTGTFTRVFSAIAAALAVAMMLLGAWRWIRFAKQKVVLRWFK